MVVDMMQYGAAVSGLQYYATAADKFTWRDVRDGIYGQTMVLREPVGWSVRWRRGTFHCSWRATSSARRCWPAARWCSKPAAETPLSVNALAEVFTEAGLPEGVLSVVPGGAETGRALTGNPNVDKTPSPAVRRSARRSAGSPPRSSSRARWNSVASRPRSSSRMPISTRRCRCCCSPA